MTNPLILFNPFKTVSCILCAGVRIFTIGEGDNTLHDTNSLSGSLGNFFIKRVMMDTNC